jgi:hypothetical protein
VGPQGGLQRANRGHKRIRRARKGHCGHGCIESSVRSVGGHPYLKNPVEHSSVLVTAMNREREEEEKKKKREDEKTEKRNRIENQRKTRM